MNIEFDKIGIIAEGEMKGWYIKIDNDSKNTGGFLIIYNPSPDMSSNSGYDDWVENEECLKKFFLESSLVVDWMK
jgi:hypothetical protein